MNDVVTFAEFPWNSLSKPDDFEIHDRTQKYPHVSITTKVSRKQVNFKAGKQEQPGWEPQERLLSAN